MIVFYALALLCVGLFIRHKIKMAKCEAGNHDWYHFRRTIEKRAKYGGVNAITQKYVACDYCGAEKEGTMEDVNTTFYYSYSAPSSYFDEMRKKGYRIESGPRRCGKYTDDEDSNDQTN